MTTPPKPTARQTGKQLHRRETRLQIYVPFGLAFLVLVAIVLVLVLPQDGMAHLRASAIANFFVTLFMLCPCVLVLFGIYVLVVAMVYGVNKLHDSAEKPLTRLENLTHEMKTRVEKTSQTVNQKAISASASIEPLMKALRIFEDSDKEEKKS
jgi:di/tricarboxylate transporter